MTLGIFNGRARAHLLNVGIIRPAAHVSAVMINEFLSDDAGAPVDCGKITDQDKGDVPRFLNRCDAMGHSESSIFIAVHVLGTAAAGMGERRPLRQVCWRTATCQTGSDFEP